MFPFLISGELGGVPLALPTFGLLVIVAITTFVLILVALNNEVKKKPLAYVIFLSVVFLAAAFSAKFGQAIIELLDPANNAKPWWLVIAQSGSTVTTGLVGALIAIVVYTRLDPHQIITWKTLDAMAVALPFAHMFGRIGCMFNGCCFGEVCSAQNPFAITYPNNWLMLPDNPDLVLGPRHASPLYEAAGLLLIGLVLLLIFKKTRARGLIISLYCLSYALLRFAVEMTRADSLRGSFGGLATGQWFSLALAAVGLVSLCQFLYRSKKQLSQEQELCVNGKPLSKSDLYGQKN